ncbi:MAG: apolipoprotein N-acyltransferase [Ignavibacteria bacterium]
MLGLSFPPVPLPYLSFIALVPFLYTIAEKERLGEINRYTYLFAVVFNLITLYWVGSWTKDADPFLMVGGTLLIFFNPIFYLIPSTLFYFSKRVFGKTVSLLLLPLYWVSFEYAYTLTDLRFPWLTLGNSQPYFNTFIQIADIIGIYGLSLIILYFNVFIFLLIKDYQSSKKINSRYATIALLIFVVPLLYGVIRKSNFEEADKRVKIGSIQPDFNPHKKWEAGNLEEQQEIYLGLAEEAVGEGAEIIMLPETALPVYLLGGRYPDEVNNFKNFADSNGTSIITGMPDATFYFDSTKAPWDAKLTSSKKYYYTSFNSILVFNPHEFEVQKYAKMMLVPFGEHVPYVEYIPLLGDLIKWNVGISSWNRGRKKNNLIVRRQFNNGLDSITVCGSICIESIYPDYISEFVKKGAEIILVVTNDSWYGNSSGPYQHKAISVLRAVENRRYVVRSANGGISCFIDPLGRTKSATKMFEKTFLVDEASLENNLTFYTRFPFIIPFICSFAAIITIISFIFFQIKRKIKE